MAHDRRFRFGVQLSTAVDAASWASLARRVEDLGYSTLLLPDHFGDQLAPLPAMMAAADATTELRVGTLVFDNDFKHPVVMAKEVATVDVLSGGRVEFGLGAGWMATDYQQSGIPMDTPAIRVDRMLEALTVIKGLWSPDPVHFDGDHYSIDGLDGRPKPLQRPHPPILIGGGAKRLLSIAAREADIVGINPSIHAGRIGPEVAVEVTPDAVDRKVSRVREAAGQRYEDLELNALVVACVVTDDRLGTATNMAALFDMTPDEVLHTPFALMGSVEEICETLERNRDRWDLSYIVVQAPAMEAFAPVVEALRGR